MPDHPILSIADVAVPEAYPERLLNEILRMEVESPQL